MTVDHEITYPCPVCKGTGIDAARTRARPDYETGYVACRPCMGRGIDAAEYFRWGPHPELKAID